MSNDPTTTVHVGMGPDGAASLLGRVAVAAESLYYANRQLRIAHERIAADLRKGQICRVFTRCADEAARVDKTAAILGAYMDAARRVGYSNDEVESAMHHQIGVLFERE